LVHAFGETHPLDVAREIESLPSEEIAHALTHLPRNVASGILAAMSPPVASSAIGQLEDKAAADLVESLPPSIGSGILRRASQERRDAILATMETKDAEALRLLLRYPDGSAGALMDPCALALPSDLPVSAALAAIRENAACVIYNLYVLGRDQMLVGVLNLHELLSARPDDRLEQISKPATHRVPALAGYRSIIDHPGWRRVHSLPVVDSEGRYLGALRYRTFRQLERLSRESEGGPEGVTARALGDLFWAGIEGVIDTLALASMRRLEREGSTADVVLPASDLGSETATDTAGDERDMSKRPG
jgi:Mg/Co/Ni transporter MgtE